jgi:hypothetical protein
MQIRATGVDGTPDPKIRAQYTKENAPQSVKFRVWLGGLAMPRQRQHKRFWSHKYLEPGLTSSSDTDALLGYFLDLHKQAESEISDATRRMVCPNDRRRPTGAEIFTVYDALDDVRIAIYDKYLAIANAEIAAAGAFNLDRALANIPSPFTVTMFYHEKSYGGSEAAANDNLALFCTNFDSVSSSM